MPARSRSHPAIERSEVTEGLLGSSLLRKPETLRELLVEELTATCPSRTWSSRGSSGRSWRTSWTDESGDDVWGGRGGSDKRQAASTRMPDVVFPNDGDRGGPRMMLVAIGPEGGWDNFRDATYRDRRRHDKEGTRRGGRQC